MICSTLTWIARNGTVVLAVGVVLGLVLQPLAHLLRPLLPYAVVVALALTLLRTDWRPLADHVRRAGRTGLAVAWLLLATTLGMWALTELAGAPAGLKAALVLHAAGPPVASAAAFALLLGLDAPLCIVSLVIALALVPLTVPTLALVLVGIEVDLALAPFMLRLALLVVASFLVAAAARRLLGAARLVQWSTPIDGLLVVTMVAFAIAIMDGVGAVLMARPGHVALLAAVAFAANVGLQAAGAGAFLWFGRRYGLTVALMSGNRDLALFLAVLPATTNPDTLLYFALGQLPMYMLPAVMRPAYRRLLHSEPERANPDDTAVSLLSK